MATAIQLLRSAVPHLRPDPGVLADGMPMVNLAENEPGMYFRLASGGLVKIGPAHVGTSAPNSSPAGFGGNTVGELWIDNTDTDKVILKAWNGTSWDEITGGDTTESSPTPPNAPEAGELWFDTANGILNYWDGAQWVPITNTPAAGLNGQVQFNDNGDFGAASSFKFSSFDDKLTVNNLEVATSGNVANLTAPLATITVANVTNLNAGIGNFTGTVTGVDLTLTSAFTGTTADLSGTLTANSGAFNQSLMAGALVSNTSVTAADGSFSNNVAITNQLTATNGTFSNQVTANFGTFNNKIDVVNAVTAGSFAIHTLSPLPAPTP